METPKPAQGGEAVGIKTEHQPVVFDISADIKRLIASQDATDLRVFEEVVNDILYAGIDHAETLLASNLAPASPFTDRDIAYSIASVGIDKSLPPELKRQFVEKAKSIFAEIAVLKTVDFPELRLEYIKRACRNLAEQLIPRVENDPIFTVTHPIPVEVTYINEAEAEHFEDSPDVLDPIYPEKYYDLLLQKGSEILERFKSQAKDAKDVIDEYSSDSSFHLMTSLRGHQLLRYKQLLDEAGRGNFSRAKIIAEESFKGLTSQAALEVLDGFVVAKMKEHIQQGNYDRAEDIALFRSGSDSESDVNDIANYMILNKAIELIKEGKDADALSLVCNGITAGAQSEARQALLPHALELARLAKGSDNEPLALEIIDRFFENAADKARGLQALALESE